MTTQRSKLLRNRETDADSGTVVVIGDTYVVSTVAQSLAERVDARVVTDDPGVAAHTEGVPVWLVDTDDGADSVSGVTRVESPSLLDADPLRSAAVESADAAVVSMETDSATLLASQLLQTKLDVTDVVALVNDPRVEDVLADVAVATTCIADVVASKTVSLVEEHTAVKRYV